MRTLVKNGLIAAADLVATIGLGRISAPISAVYNGRRVSERCSLP